MNLRDCLICGYYNEDNFKDYVVEINTKLLEQFIKENYSEYSNFKENITSKIAVYEILKNEFAKDLKIEEFAVELV